MKDDTISRQAAVTALNGCTEIYLNNLPSTIYKSDAVDAITALPSAQPNANINREKMDEYFYNLIGWLDGIVHAEQVIAMRYWVERIYAEIFGEGEKPKWMT